MWPVITDILWSLCVCLSVCLSVTTVSCTKTDELIQMPRGLWTEMGPKNHVLGGGPDLPRGSANFLKGRAPLRCSVLSAFDQLFEMYFLYVIVLLFADHFCKRLFDCSVTVARSEPKQPSEQHCGSVVPRKPSRV